MLNILVFLKCVHLSVFFGLENLNFDRRKDKLKCEKIQRKPQKRGRVGVNPHF